MSRQRRWLWPCSESKVLRHKHFQRIIYDPCPHGNHEDDVLLSGSDDELDPSQHKDKKRRVESLAHSYLNGTHLFIQSAALKGPFDNRPDHARDKYACHVVGSPILPSPEPALVRNPVSTQTFVSSKRLPAPTRSPALPSSPNPPDALGTVPPVVAPFWNVTAPAGFTSVNRPRLEQPPAEHAAAQHCAEDPPTHRPRHVVTCHLSSTSKAKSPQTSTTSVRRKKYLEAATTRDDSPLLYRRKKQPKAKTTKPANKPTTTPTSIANHSTTTPVSMANDSTTTPTNQNSQTTKRKARRVLFNSSVNVPTPIPKPAKHSQSSSHARTPPALTKSIAPAIDISFDQGSLAMHFDFIDQHTNVLLPAPTELPAGTCSVSKRLRHVMRLCGASFTADSSVKHETTALSDGYEGPADLTVDRPRTTPSSSSAEQHQPASYAKVRDVTTMEDRLPVISTQAAMEAAHRGLFDASSPMKPCIEANGMEQATPGPPLAHSPAHPIMITPFHEFNAQIAAEAPPSVLQSQPPNTQAMFNNLSPFLSPNVSKQATRQQKARKRASFAPITEESNSMLALSSLTPPAKYSFTPIDTTDSRQWRSVKPSIHGILSRSGDISASQQELAQSLLLEESAPITDVLEDLHGSHGSKVNVEELYSTKSFEEIPNIGTLTQPESTGSTSIADAQRTESPESAHQRHVQSSNLMTASYGGQTPALQTAYVMSGPPASSRSRPSLRTSASNLGAAQRADDFDLDSTIEGITQSVLSSWDVESAMRRPVRTG